MPARPTAAAEREAMTVFEQRRREAAFPEDVPSALRTTPGRHRVAGGSSTPLTQKLGTLYLKNDP
jgi:hypothetical protein